MSISISFVSYCLKIPLVLIIIPLHNYKGMTPSAMLLVLTRDGSRCVIAEL